MSDHQFTAEQEGHARLAQMLRELAPHMKDVELEPIGEHRCIWPGANIRERLMDAADLIETLLIEQAKRGRP